MEATSDKSKRQFALTYCHPLCYQAQVSKEEALRMSDEEMVDDGSSCIVPHLMLRTVDKAHKRPEGQRLEIRSKSYSMTCDILNCWGDSPSHRDDEHTKAMMHDLTTPSGYRCPFCGAPWPIMPGIYFGGTVSTIYKGRGDNWRKITCGVCGWCWAKSEIRDLILKGEMPIDEVKDFSQPVLPQPEVFVRHKSTEEN